VNVDFSATCDETIIQARIVVRTVAECGSRSAACEASIEIIKTASLGTTFADGTIAGGTQFAHPFDNDNLNGSLRINNSVKYTSLRFHGFWSAACMVSPMQPGTSPTIAHTVSPRGK
jgi:hypothetical protein